MENLYESVRDSLLFNKFMLDDLVCVEYSCPVEEKHVGIYTQTDYIIHVLSGKKTWKTIHDTIEVCAGETLFVKKGAAIVIQDFDEDFCMLGFFLPDDLIRESLVNIIHKIPIPNDQEIHRFTASKLISKSYLKGFFQSMLPYFEERIQPPDSIISLKLKELLINIIYNCDNPLLIAYLKSLTVNSELSLPHIMETNFCYNLKLEEFAKMCHRSLSKFKRDFFNHYNTTPGKWLIKKRLSHAANLLLKDSSNISQTAFESGFEDVSHFSRAFKSHFGQSPSTYCKLHV